MIGAELMKSRGLLAAIVAVFSMVGCATRLGPSAIQAQPKDEVIDLGEAVATALSEMLAPELVERDVPGAAWALVSREKIIAEGVHGVTDNKGLLPIGPDTLFCVRSISKSVTALAVLVAVQEGLVDLDTPISSYLPDFSVNNRFGGRPEDEITLRHMLSHRAGFTHDPPAKFSTAGVDYFERYIETITASWLKAPVGYKHSYSNYGFDLAAYILQTRSGQPFEDYVKEKVLDPIGMTGSLFDLEEVTERSDRAIGHLRDGRTVALHFPEIASAGLYASMRDMSRYLQFQLGQGVIGGRRIIREDLMKQYYAIQFAHHDQRTGYSFGLWREVVSNTLSFYHEGGGRGFGAHLIFYPELGFGVVTLTNMEYHGLTGLQGRQVMNGPIVKALGQLPIPDLKRSGSSRLEAHDPRIKAVLGRYGDSPGVVVGFEQGVLGLRLDENQFHALTFYNERGDLVGVYSSDNEVRFLPAQNQKPGSMMMILRSYGNMHCNYRDFNDSPRDVPGPKRPEWAQYVGEYDILWVNDTTSAVSIEVRNGYLYFRDGKCEELEPGLFAHYDGEMVDLRSALPTYSNNVLRRR